MTTMMPPPQINGFTRTDARAVSKAAAAEAKARADAMAADALAKAGQASHQAVINGLEAEEARQKLRLAQAKADAQIGQIQDGVKEKKTKARREAWARRRQALAGQAPLIVASVLVAALVVISVYFAWDGQAAGFRDKMHAAANLVPMVTEGVTWTMAALAFYAHVKGRPTLKYRLVTALAAIVAAALNYQHHKAEGTGEVYAIASLSGVFVWELFLSLLMKAKEGRPMAEVRADLARTLAHPVIALAAWRIRAIAHGSITADAAWAEAWDQYHAPTLGVTARRERRRRKNRARLQDAMLADTGLPETADDTDTNVTDTEDVTELGVYTDEPAAPARASALWLPGLDGWVEPTVKPTAKPDVHAPKPQVNTPIPPTEKAPEKGPGRAPVRRQSAIARAAARHTAKKAQKDADALAAKRDKARADIAALLNRGEKPSPAALGKAYGLSPDWGSKQIKAVESDPTAYGVTA
ncbi:DUF2637 domain-containing protein [Kitasatospora cathayae]|uniref:DUF2637 domain-containing protein n=1 Tax=Kitasatospora cathayae TaxID=3004092 RepID=A0ABY7QH97_9ACTN|nr:DUF2637 domain-containing protein [Kitasatospora sp. HUAS 3-15]WBP92188.1 DUF2637 domain-containing protein [Kitasatospora sp. HUAS 3-15]